VILLLAYFPTFYEDELLYSGIARYHGNSGNKTQRQTIEDLFGSQLVCATVDLPSHILSLADKLNRQYTSDQIINRHTLCPYYTYFMKQEKIHQAKCLMEIGSKQGEVHASLGLLASAIKLPTKLKFCLECYKADSEISEPYWHRSHQLPGVIMCPMHNNILKVSTVEYSTLNHKFSFVPLALAGELEYTQPVVDLKWWDHLMFIAVQSELFMQTDSRSKREAPCYKNLLQDYRTVGGRIRFNRLIHDFRSFYTDNLLKYLNCNVDSNSSDTWLHKIVRDQEEITHPLRHLLLIRFLGISLCDISVQKEKHPFGIGPWPCLNKSASHYHQSVVEKCEITRCSTTSKPVGTFYCTCGFVYSRRGPNINDEDRKRIGRIKAFGPVWYDKLRCLNETHISLRQKAKILGVDPGTIKTQTDILNHNKAGLKKIGNLGRIGTSTRKGAKVNGVSRSKIKIKLDWSQRDEWLYGMVVMAVERINNSHVPQRISLASIVRFTNSSELSTKLVKNLNKLPKTNNFIKKHSDSTETYQIRRLIWAANKLHEVEGKLLGWRLLKLAGLNHPLRKAVNIKYMELLR
jgi:hypothetical protein